MQLHQAYTYQSGNYSIFENSLLAAPRLSVQDRLLFLPPLPCWKSLQIYQDLSSMLPSGHLQPYLSILAESVKQDLSTARLHLHLYIYNLHFAPQSLSCWHIFFQSPCS